MLERPDLLDELIISHIEHDFGLHVARLTFLPLGADFNTAVYRLVTENETAYFLKLRRGDFDEITVAVPHCLKAQGNPAIIAPLETKTGRLWARMGVYTTIVYPFVEGQDGYQVTLSDQQWREFGAALKGIHTAQIPPDIARLIPNETFSPHWREMVKTFQAQIEEATYDDPTAAKFAVLMKARQGEISQLVSRADELGFMLKNRPLDPVLCHTDIHAGNLHIGTDGALYIVDWDNPVSAPKERDLMLVGGSYVWNSSREEDLFYQGYGRTAIDRIALAYYRYERIVQDIAAYCEQLLSTDEGGEDREQGYQYFTSNFLPGHEIEIAFRTDPLFAS